MGAMIGGGESTYRFGRRLLATLLGCGDIDQKIYNIRLELRYGIMTMHKHHLGFSREIHKSGWSTHTQLVQDLCQQWFFNNPEVWERDQEGTKVKRKGKPTEVNISILKLYFCKLFCRDLFKLSSKKV